MTTEKLYPPAVEGLTEVVAPIVRVTLLEDRALIHREGKIVVKKGQNRLRIRDVTAVLQDVSLKGECVLSSVRVSDTRARRAMRVRREEKPELARSLEDQIEGLHRRISDHVTERDRAVERFDRAYEILSLGLSEISDDAGWGQVNPQHWQDTFEVLFKRARALRRTVLEEHAIAEGLGDELGSLVSKRTALDRLDHRLVGWIEMDLLSDEAGEIPFSVEYVVPNAMWRPMHSARLDGETLELTSSGAVWQNTGEDWVDVELVFSTARSSLGTEPPLLSDDRLGAQKKNETLVIAKRQVVVQKASVGGTAKAQGIALPGVDDGGDIRTLHAMSKRSIPSDGRASIVPLFVIESRATTSLVSCPELEPKAFLKSVQHNTGRHPILAGPVELIRQSGFVGWTQVGFVAPGEAFSLSFGPDDAIRIVRVPYASMEIREVDRWKIVTHENYLFVSNLSGEPRKVELTERIPVSEIEQVKVVVDGAVSTPPTSHDENGFYLIVLELNPNAQNTAHLKYQVETAPGVQGG